MFFERTLQSQIIQDELQHTPRWRSRYLEPENNTARVVKNKAIAYLELFLETSSIHGLNHLLAPRRYLETTLWLIVIALSAFGSVYLSQITWSRYQSSPTVVSMDRDMYEWNTTFPAVTVCPEKRLDEKKLEIYLRNSKETNKSKLEAFIRDLSNATYKNFNNMTDYDGVASDQYIELLLNLSAAFKPTLTIGVVNVAFNIVPTITEMGLCYSVNSGTAVYNSPEYRKANRWDTIGDEYNSLYIHPLEGEVFAQIINISTAYDAYIHSPQEVPDISTKNQQSKEAYYMKIYVTAIAVYTSAEAATLRVSQRRCRFPHENNLKHNSIYTYAMCRMECRIRLCLKHCGCIPHFYRNIGDEKICDVKGLHCLAKFKDELFKLQHADGKRINCGCYPLCDDVNYVLQSNAKQEWFLGTNLQLGMVTYPRMRYKRDIIFGFTDVLEMVTGNNGMMSGRVLDICRSNEDCSFRCSQMCVGMSRGGACLGERCWCRLGLMEHTMDMDWS